MALPNTFLGALVTQAQLHTHTSNGSASPMLVKVVSKLMDGGNG